MTKKVLIGFAIFFCVVIYFRMRNERIEQDAKNKEEEDAKKDTKD